MSGTTSGGANPQRHPQDWTPEQKAEYEKIMRPYDEKRQRDIEDFEREFAKHIKP